MRQNMKSILTLIIVLTLSLLGFILGGEQLSTLQTETFRILVIIALISMIYCFLVGELTGNNSQVDKLWSILPIIYAWVIVGKSEVSLRLIVMAILVSLWGIRLTYNFAKKGAYSIRFWSGEEDYRWVVLREDPRLNKRWKWALFNLFFISIYQHALILAISLPLLAVMESTVAFGLFDVIISLLLLGFLILESIADRQQNRFQTKKYELLEQANKLEDLPSPYNRGFSIEGLWGRSRHPNYFAEQAIWITLYLFCISAAVTESIFFHWTLVGPMFLILLFLGSSMFSEGVSLKKYPEYKEYSENTSKYIPLKKYKK